jgi:hypothetical protein
MMKKIIVILLLSTILSVSTKAQEKNNNKFSFNFILRGCNSNEYIGCKNIAEGKKQIESAFSDNVPDIITVPMASLYSIFNDKGLNFRNTFSDKDSILLKKNEISYEINFSF